MEASNETPLACYDPEFAAQQMLSDGYTTESLLRSMIPKGTPNSFKPSSMIKCGYKYRFSINGTQIELKWHSPDLVAASKYPGCNSGSMWTAQVKVGKKLLGADGSFYKSPSNITHIPLKGR